MIKKIAYYSILFSIICIVLNLTILTKIPISIFYIDIKKFWDLLLLSKNPFFLLLVLMTLILSIVTLLQIKKNRTTFPFIMIILYIVDLVKEIVMITGTLNFVKIFMDIYYVIILVIYFFDPSRENNELYK